MSSLMQLFILFYTSHSMHFSVYISNFASDRIHLILCISYVASHSMHLMLCISFYIFLTDGQTDIGTYKAAIAAKNRDEAQTITKESMAMQAYRN